MVHREELLVKIEISVRRPNFSNEWLESFFGRYNVFVRALRGLVLLDDFDNGGVFKPRLLRFKKVHGNRSQERFFNVAIFLCLNHFKPFEDA